MMSAIFAFLLIGAASVSTYHPLHSAPQAKEALSAAVQQTSAALSAFYQPTAVCMNEGLSRLTLLLTRPLNSTDSVLYAHLQMKHTEFDSLLRPAAKADDTASHGAAQQEPPLSRQLRQLHDNAPLAAILASIEFPVQRGRYAAAQKRLNASWKKYRGSLSAEDNIRLSATSAALLLQAEDYEKAAEQLSELIAALKEIHGADHPLPIGVTEFLADICVSNQPKLAQESWFDEVIAYRSRHNDPSLHYALYLKGLYHISHHAPEAAEPLLEQAVFTLTGAPELTDEAGGKDTVAEADELAATEAEAAQQLAIRQHLANQPASEQLLSYIGKLATVLSDQEKYSRALPYLEYAVAANAESEHVTSSKRVATLEDLSTALAMTGEGARAEALLLHDIDLIENLPEGSAGVDANTAFTAKISLMDHLSYVYFETDRLPDAISLLQTVLEQERGFRGWTHIDTAVTLNRIGRCYSWMDDYAKATDYYEQSVAISGQNMPEYTSSHIEFLSDLAIGYEQTERWQEAVQTLTQWLEHSTAELGQYHVHHISIWQDLASNYNRLSRDAEALQALENALQQARALFPNGSHATADTLHMIGLFYFWSSEYQAALPWFEQASQVFKDFVPEKHHDALMTMAYLGYTQYALDNTQEAMALLERANTLAEENYPPESNVRVNATYHLASILLQEGQPARSMPYFREVLLQIDTNPEYRELYPYLRDVLQDTADNARALGLDQEAQASEVRIALIMADISEDGRETASPATPAAKTLPATLPKANAPESTPSTGMDAPATGNAAPLGDTDAQ